MKKSTARMAMLMVALTAILLLSSCLTTRIPERQSPDECLFLIQTRLENPHHAPLARNYVFVLSDGSEKRISSSSESFMAIPIGPAGERIVALKTRVSGNYTGDTHTMPIDLVLPYEAGEVIVAEWGFVHEIQKNSNSSYISMPNFYDLSADDRAVLLNDFYEDPASESWVN